MVTNEVRGASDEQLNTVFVTVLSIPTFAGYGMTESGPGTHMSPRSKQKPGSVGIILPNTECKVSNYKVSFEENSNIMLFLSNHKRFPKEAIPLHT